DVFGAFVPDDLLDVRERFLNVRSEDGTVRIRVQEVHDTGDPWLGRPAAVVPAEGHRSLGLAVERSPLGQDLVALGEEPGDLDRVLVRLAAARRADRLREVARRDRGKQPRERRAALLAERGRHVANSLRLLLNAAHDPRMSVAEVDVDQAG